MLELAPQLSKATDGLKAGADIGIHILLHHRRITLPATSRRIGPQLLLSLLCLLLCVSAGFAQTPPACPPENTAQPVDLANWIFSQPTSMRKQGQAMMKRLPAGNSVDILIDDAYNNRKSYRGIVKWRRATKGLPFPDWLQLSPVWTSEVTGSAAIVLAGNEWARGKTLVSFDLPQNFESIGEEITLAFAACDSPGTVAPSAQNHSAEFSVVLNAPTSNRWFSISLSIAAVTIGYVAAATALSRLQKKSWTLDPVVLTAGWDGRGSPAKLQLLFFTLIVAGLLTYILCRAGFLSDLSKTVLLLIGISSVGAIAARSADITKNRLDYENWAWAVRKGWLLKEGFAAERHPEWKDLLTVQGEFDVSRFQLLVFSVVVGIALLQIGLTDLSTFSVPDALLGLLGLSQVTYVFGKALGSTDVKELDTAISVLRKIEDDFVAKAGAAIDPAPVSPGVTAPPPGDLLSAKRRAAAEYGLYVEKEQNVRAMFETSLGVKLSKVEPRYI